MTLLLQMLVCTATIRACPLALAASEESSASRRQATERASAALALQVQLLIRPSSLLGESCCLALRNLPLSAVHVSLAHSARDKAPRSATNVLSEHRVDSQAPPLARTAQEERIPGMQDASTAC